VAVRVTDPGVAVAPFADRKNGLGGGKVAVLSSITSTKGAQRDRSRDQIYRHPPRTRLEVSSTYPLGSTCLVRRRRRFSAMFAGVSLGFPHRTAHREGAPRDQAPIFPDLRNGACSERSHSPTRALTALGYWGSVQEGRRCAR